MNRVTCQFVKRKRKRKKNVTNCVNKCFLRVKLYYIISEDRAIETKTESCSEKDKVRDRK